ncbi:SCO2583 family membrane protein [Streptomyces sp. NPDC002537]
MDGPGDPPEGGTPEGVPGGEDEYRSVVFDESFIRAARLQEYSARERMGDHALAVRNRHVWARVSTSRQVLVLVILIALAFGTAVYMGLRHPYKDAAVPVAEPLRSTVVPLAPRDAVPGGPAGELFDHSPAAQFRLGQEGITLPPARSTQHFSESQVMAALAAAKEYTVKSALDPAVLLGGAQRSVRLLLDPAQLDQFDRSFDHPAADGRHAATGWLIRFDPGQVALVDTPVRTQGVFTVTETSPGTLEVSGDHTFVYALRPAKTTGDEGASLFTVRRALRFRFDRDGLQDHHLTVLQSYVQAGPESCSADDGGFLRPLLAGQRPGTDGPAATDPYATGQETTALCGTLSAGAQPNVPRH